MWLQSHLLPLGGITYTEKNAAPWTRDESGSSLIWSETLKKSTKKLRDDNKPWREISIFISVSLVNLIKWELTWILFWQDVTLGGYLTDPRSVSL